MRHSFIPRSERTRWLLIVAFGCLLLGALDAWWVVAFRHGNPLDIDEAGYTVIGLNDYIGLQNGGLHGWWESIQSQPPNAPLLPAITSLALLLHPGVLAGYFVLIGFAVALVLAVYGIGERLAGPRLGALAALVVATSEGLFNYTREYIFALPTAVFLSCAVYALLRSEGLRRTRWALVCGAALGLMLLSRTMSIAFVPGVLLAAILVALARGEAPSLKARFVNFGLLLGVGLAIAAGWYWRNLTPVLDYLTNYGYGSKSQYYGAEHALISWGRFKDIAERMVVFDLLVPVALLLAIGFAAGLVMTVKRVGRAEERRREMISLLGSDSMCIMIVVGVGFAALMSSRNGGNGFTFPLAVLLPTVAVLVLKKAPRAIVVPVVAVVAAIALLNVATATDLSASLSKPSSVDLPLFGFLPWRDGTLNALDVMRIEEAGPSTHFSNADKGWPELDAQLADLLLEPIGPGESQPLVGVAVRNRFLNINTINLAAVLQHHVGLPIVALEAEPNDSVATYTKEIRDSPFGELTALLTASSELNDFEPVVTQSKAETATRRLGFEMLRQFEMPDGRRLRLWVKQS